MSSYNTSKEKTISKAFFEHSGLILGFFCGLNWILYYNTLVKCLLQFWSLKLDRYSLFSHMAFAEWKEESKD